MKRNLIIAALLALGCTTANAQEKLFNRPNVESPVVNADGTVTFNLYAPNVRRAGMSDAVFAPSI